MKVYPLKSMSLDQASQKQFHLVDEITKEFKGTEFLGLGDLGINPLGNIPQTTRKVEKVLARFFNQDDCAFVRGSGTAAIREAMASILEPNDTILVHKAPIYSTTITTINQLGINLIECNFNDLLEIEHTIKANKHIKAVLIQFTRQKLTDSYEIKEVIKTIKSIKDVPIITDDNYAVMKVENIGVELGADLSCFSSFKLLGPEGVGVVVGKQSMIDKIHEFHYSGGSQTQGHEALSALRGMVFAPVTHAIQSLEAEKIVKAINENKINGIEEALIVNAQSKVVLVRFTTGIAKEVLLNAEVLGAAPYPIGAESKYELAPMFYRLSGTIIKDNPQFETHWIRINPMRSGSDTVLRILKEAVQQCF